MCTLHQEVIKGHSPACYKVVLKEVVNGEVKYFSVAMGKSVEYHSKKAIIPPDTQPKFVLFFALDLLQEGSMYNNPNYKGKTAGFMDLYDAKGLLNTITDYGYTSDKEVKQNLYGNCVLVILKIRFLKHYQRGHYGDSKGTFAGRVMEVIEEVRL